MSITDIMVKSIESSKDLLTEIYGDLAKPAVSEVGKALGTIIGLGNTLLLPLAMQNEKSKILIQHNLEEYRKKLEQIPEEKIQEVVPEVGVPVLEKLMYVSDEHLLNMYTELLAKASDISECYKAHPGFVHVINSLSPQEALILNQLKENPLAFVTISVKVKENYHPIGEVYSELEFNESKNNLNALYSNLQSLGIIKIERNIFINDASRYDVLEKHCKEHHPIINAPEKFPSRKPATYGGQQIWNSIVEKNYSFNRGRMDLTPYGELFLKAVSENPTN